VNRDELDEHVGEFIALVLEVQTLRNAGIRPRRIRERLGLDMHQYARVRRWLDDAAARIDAAVLEDALRQRGAEAVTAAMRLVELNHRIGNSRRQTKRQLGLTEQQLADGFALVREGGFPR